MLPDTHACSPAMATTMTRAQRQANRLRRTLFVVGIVYVVFALAWLVMPYLNKYLDQKGIDFVSTGLFSTPLLPTPLYGNTGGERKYALNLGLFVGVILLAQWWFLQPGHGWMGRLTAEARPLRGAVIVAAAMAMLLSTGLAALLLELPNWWEYFINNTGTSDRWLWAPVWGGMLLLWGLWAWVFFVY